jgi:hypothetical protein
MFPHPATFCCTFTSSPVTPLYSIVTFSIDVSSKCQVSVFFILLSKEKKKDRPHHPPGAKMYRTHRFVETRLLSLPKIEPGYPITVI